MALGEGAFEAWAAASRVAGTCAGEKPRVTIVARSWLDGCGAGSGAGSEADDCVDKLSDELHDDWLVVEPVRGEAERCSTERQRGMLGSGAVRGSLDSIIETTIFSSSSEVIWRWFPRLRLLAHESCLRILGRTMSIRADSVPKSTASSSATESTLPDS